MPTPNSKSSGASESHSQISPIPADPLIIAKKEAKRLEKEAKLAAKTEKVAATTPAGEKKVKVEKAKKEAEPEFVNNTPPGQKKGAHHLKASYLTS